MIGLLWLASCGLFSEGGLFGPDVPEGTSELMMSMPNGVPLRAPSDPLPRRWRCEEADAEPRCFLSLPGGVVTMGAQSTDPDGPRYDPDAGAEESPLKTADVAPFRMQRHEVSFSSWGMCVARDVCPEDADGPRGALPRRPDGAMDFMALPPGPVRSVSWSEAATYCAFLGARLPTEAEWEWAARGDSDRKWPWGDKATCGRTKFIANGDRVDAMPPCDDVVPPDPRNLYFDDSPFGVRGLGGSLWEWVEDVFVPGAGPGAGVPPDAPPDAPRVQRGGSYLEPEPEGLRAAIRVGVAPDTKLEDVGFRCVWSGP